MDNKHQNGEPEGRAESAAEAKETTNCQYGRWCDKHRVIHDTTGDKNNNIPAEPAVVSASTETALLCGNCARGECISGDHECNKAECQCQNQWCVETRKQYSSSAAQPVAADLPNQHFAKMRMREQEQADSLRLASSSSEAWRDLPIGYWFFSDSPICTNRYSVMERTDSGSTSICSSPWHHQGAVKDLQEIVRLHNAGLADLPNNGHFCEHGVCCELCRQGLMVSSQNGKGESDKESDCPTSPIVGVGSSPTSPTNLTREVMPTEPTEEK